MQSLWMIVAAFLFSAMGVCVKLASDEYNIWEIVMYRGAVGLLFMTGLTYARHGALKRPLVTDRLAMHLQRGISGTVALSMWFFAIAGLPIATAMTLNYSSPLFVGLAVAVAAWRAGTAPEGRMQAVILIGFVGVILLLQPTIARDQWLYAVVGLTSSTLSAVAYLSVKALSEAGEPEGRIVFYFSGMNALSGLIGAAIFGFHAHSLRGGLLLVALGICATLAQLAMTRAYGSGRVLLTANLGFTGIVFSSLWGVFLFQDVMHPLSLVGMGVIIVSGVLATLFSARAKLPANEAVEPSAAA